MVIANRTALASRLLLAALVCGCASTGGSTSDTGTGANTIRVRKIGLGGKLILPPPPATIVSNGDTARGRVPSSTEEATDAVIYLVAHNDEHTKPLTAHDTVTLTATGFDRRIVPVVVGTKVKIRNEDQIFHSLFSVSPVRPFDLEPQEPGGSHSVTFDKVGVVNVYCKLHSAEACFIIVLPDEHFTRPNPRGEFSFPMLAAGNYTVKAWHPVYGETKRKVNLSKQGKLNLKLSY